MTAKFKHKSCIQIQKLISAYIDGELSERDRIYVEAHLASCNECRALYDELLLISATAQNASYEAPPQLHDDIMNSIRAAAPQSTNKFSSMRFMRFGSIALVCVLLVTCTITFLPTLKKQSENLFGNNAPSFDFSGSHLAGAPDKDGVASPEENIPFEPSSEAISQALNNAISYKYPTNQDVVNTPSSDSDFEYSKGCPIINILNSSEITFKTADGILYTGEYYFDGEMFSMSFEIDGNKTETVFKIFEANGTLNAKYESGDKIW